MNVTFGNTTDDSLGIILTRKEIASPSPKTSYIEIPGSNGNLDLTEFFGGVKYSNRDIKMNFTSKNPSVSVWSNVMGKLNGRLFEIRFDDDEGFFYKGRISMDLWNREKSTSSFSIVANCEPYKFKDEETTIQLNSGNNVVENGAMPTVPSFTTTQNTTITFSDYSISLGIGTFQVPSIELKQGENTINCSVPCTIKFQEGEF